MEKRPAAWLWGVALVPTLVLGVLRWSAGPGIGAEDHAQYELHARALAEGIPYRDTGYLPSRLNAGHGPGALPPGVPVVLAIAFRLAGEHPATIKTVMMALSLAAFLIAGLYFAATGEPWLGLGVTLLIGLSPGVVRYANLAQSDLPLCLGVWLLLLLADRPGAWSWGRVAAITLTGFATLTFRLLGGVIVPVMFIVAAMRWRELRWRGLVPPLAWTLAGVAGVVVLGASNLARDPTFLYGIVGNLWGQFQFYREVAGDALAYPFPWDRANHLYQLLGLVVTAVGLLLWFRASARRAAPVFAVLYGLVLLISPFAVPRYLWPLFPLLVFGLLKGVAFLVGRLRPAVRPEPATLTLAGLIAVAAALWIALSPPPGSFATQPSAVALFAELRRLDAEQPMRTSFARPRILALETGIQSLPLLRRPPDEVEAELNRQCVTHIIIGSLGLRLDHDRAYRLMVATRPADFALVWSSKEFQVYRFVALRPDNCPAALRQGAAAQ